MRPAVAIVFATFVITILLASGLPATEAGATHLAGKKFAIDAGHGGSDPGAQGFGLNEKTVNLDIARRVRDLLEEEGATVYMTRDCDCTVSLSARSSGANNWGAHRFISIHANACGSCGGHGTETYYYSGLSSTSTAAKLAGLAQDELIDHGKLRDRGVKTANFHVLRETNMPAILIETGFVDHSGDNAKLSSATWRQEAARAVLHAVHRHYGITPHDPATPPPPTPFDVSVVSPTHNAWVKDTVTVQGATTNEGDLGWMRIKVDGAVTKWVTPQPHTWSWNTNAYATGAHTVTVEGRSNGGVTKSASVTARVDNVAPSADITNPRAGAVNVANTWVNTGGATVVVGDITVRATANDAASGVQDVRFYLDGALQRTDSASPFEWAWDTAGSSAGAHTLTIVARDVAGNTRSVTRAVDVLVPV